MPMPHQTFSQLIRRRLVGKEGKARLRELEQVLQELPDYKNGHVAGSVHKDVAAVCSGARVWGPSARFPGQQVGRHHELRDGDTVEITR